MNSEERESLLRRIQALFAEPSDRFDTLVRATGLDPKTDLRFGDWRGLDFAGNDLRGFDLTGADLRGSNFRGAKIEDVCFKAANLSGVIGLPSAVYAALREDEISRQIATAQLELRWALKGWKKEEVDSHIARFRPSYWLSVSLDEAVSHTKFLRRMRKERKAYLFDRISFDVRQNLIVFTVASPDYPSLLSVITGACMTSGANIVSALVHTTIDGLALDTISIARHSEKEQTEAQHAISIATTIEQSIKNKYLPKPVATAPSDGDRSIDAGVVIDNGLADDYTVVEVAGRDRPGLLYELTRMLYKLDVNIAAAYVQTFGERVVDVFHVSDFAQKKIEQSRFEDIKRRLTSVVSGV